VIDLRRTILRQRGQFVVRHVGERVADLLPYRLWDLLRRRSSVALIAAVWCTVVSAMADMRRQPFQGFVEQRGERFARLARAL